MEESILRGLKFLSKSTEYLSMDIGSHSIKLVTGKIDKNKININHTTTISMPENAYEDGKINNMLEVKEAIKRALNEHKIQTKSVICTIESTFILTREIILPAVTPEEMKEMIGYEIGEYLPIELEKYVIQYKVIEEFIEGDVKKIKLLVAALPTEIAQSYFELIEFLGLEPIALDIHSNAISKLFHPSAIINQRDRIHDKTIALLDLGHRHINVVILQKGAYKFHRIIPVGAVEIDTVSASYFNLDPKEAQLKKYELDDMNASGEDVAAGLDRIHSNRSYDLSEKNSGSNIFVLDAVRSTVDAWIDEINKVFKYYTSRSAHNSIDVVYLYGGSAQFQDIAAYISGFLNIPTYIVNQIDAVAFIEPLASEQLSAYLNAIGALIRK